MSRTRRQTSVRIALVGGSQLLQKLVGFLIIAIMTRHFPRDDLGEFFLAAAIGAITAQATELGTGRHLIRSIARDPKSAPAELSLVLSLRLPLMLAAYVAVNLTCLAVRPSLSPTLLVVSLYLLLHDLQLAYAAFFVGLERYRLRVAVDVVGQVLLAGLTLLLARRGGGLHSLLWAYVGAYTAMLAVTTALVTARFGAVRLRWSRSRALVVVRRSLPIFGVALLDALHARADTILLGFLRPLPEVAAYAAAYRLLEVSRVGIRPVALIFFPICVGLAARHDWSGLRRLFGKLARAGLVAGTGAALLVVAAAGVVVPLVFGPGYADAVPLVRILFFGAPMLFTGLLAVALIHTLHLEREAMLAGIGCVAANLVLNAVAIPLWGPLGAAVVSITTQALWTVLLARLVLTHLDESAGPEPSPAEASSSALEEARMESVE